MVIVGILVLGGAAWGGYHWWQNRSNGPTACTMEAKQCSDGSYVGRTGPNCEFAICPSATPDQTADWQTYQNDQYGFEIKYPAKYKTSQDTYGWSHSLVLFLSPSGQSYIIQVEVWDTPDAFKNIYKTDPPFIVKTKDNKYITINHAGFEEKSIPEWSGMIASFKFIQ